MLRFKGCYLRIAFWNNLPGLIGRIKFAPGFINIINIIVPAPHITTTPVKMLVQHPGGAMGAIVAINH